MTNSEPWRNVGRRIRSLRKTYQLTLKQLASGSSLSANALSLIERGQVAPTVSTLCRIATALGVPASTFLQDICPDDLELVRADERRFPADTLGALTCALDAPKGRNDIFPDETEFDLEGDPSPARQTVLCVSGQLEYRSDGRKCTLSPGDRLTFNSYAPHWWHNCGAGTGVAVMIVPISQPEYSRNS
jgi:transcriptional regulator with XRE-family HTH domain